MNREPTIAILTKEAKKLGIKRSRGSYNNEPFWQYEGQKAIITRCRLLEILGYTSMEFLGD